LFGFDFLLDEDLRTYIIEVNTNPHLGSDAEVLTKLVPNMIHHMLEIALDPSFPCGDEISPDNKWKLILSDSKKINLRRPFS
jgi:hypothetical protein